jgi:hypothetical protein
MKRIFFIVAGVIVIIGLVVGGYFLFFSGKQATLTTVTGNPFANTSASDALNTNSVATGAVANAGTEVGPRLIKITDGPVAEGSIAIDRPPVYATATTTVPTDSSSITTVSLASSTVTTSTSTKTTSTKKVTTRTAPVVETTQTIVRPADTEVRYIERASGNVYSFMAHARTLTRISNKTLPGIQQVSWLPDGSRAYAQYISRDSTAGDENVSTYALLADGSGGAVLEQGLAEAKAVGSSTLFTLLSGTTGSVGSFSRADGSVGSVAFTSNIGGLVVHPTTNGSLFAATKASSGLQGYAFSVSRATGAFTRILGGLRGLAILSNLQGTAVLYSFNDNGTYRMAVYDTSTRVATALPVATLAEKCTWAANGLSAYCAIPLSTGGNLPDFWYQGVTTFTDRIWKIDLVSRTASLVVDPSTIGKVNIDATALAVDPNEDVLVFTDRVTGSLWEYDL